MRERLASAAGTSIVISGPVSNATAPGYTTALGADLTAALAGSPSAFYHAYYSDPLGLPIRTLPVNTGKDTPITEAATFGDVTAHARLLAGAWPAAPPPAGRYPRRCPRRRRPCCTWRRGTCCG